MPKNLAEKQIKLINNQFFLKEFTFSRNEYKLAGTNQQVELADNIVWIDEIVIVSQIKERESISGTTSEQEIKWFDNKVLRKAIQQIKNTINYLKEARKVDIVNDRGHRQNLGQIDIRTIKKLVIYSPSNQLPEEKRFIKFYESSKVGPIHLLNLEDYAWICKYLITPAEINDYLDFREELYTQFKQLLDLFPEQLLLGHYLSGDPIASFSPRHIDYLNNFIQDADEFEFLHILKKFWKKQFNFIGEGETNYYSIIKEIAKLKRYELREFKRRFTRTWEKSKVLEPETPYRMTIPRTECGFVFIPISGEFRSYWQNALRNYTLAHKYDQKLNKCIGVVIFRSDEPSDDLNVYWMLIEYLWEHDGSIERKLEENFPFRAVDYGELGRYSFKDKS